MAIVFTDRFDHSIDEKNRLAIPSAIRSALDPESAGVAFYMVPEGRYLQLIPEALFLQLSSAANAGLTVGYDLARARRLLFSTASRLVPDKAGRVVIPERYLLDAKNHTPFGEALLERQVTLVGVGDRVELWNTGDFYAHLRELLADRQQVQSATQQLFNAVPQAGAKGPM
jgi:MraZ protein